MKLTYIALTAGAIALIGAIGMSGPGRKLPLTEAQAQSSDAFEQAYEQILENDTPATAPAPEPRFAPVSEAQAQEPSENLRNLSTSAQAPQGDAVTEISRGQTETAPPQEPATPAVDESALRYFAQQGDLQRLQAEISRLRSLYPNWTPPANPLAVEDGEDEQLNAMWAAYAKGDYAEVHQLIQDRRTEEPDWTPPADLVNRLHIAETRTKLLSAAEDSNWEDVIDYASQAPSLLTCAEINVLWQVGEAFAQTDKLSRAMDAYTYILKNCDNPQERLATMQKAMAFMPYDDMKTLLGFERQDDDGKGEFQEIRDALLRDRFAQAGEDKTIVVSPDDLAHMEKLANDSQDAKDSELLAWYFLVRGSESAAEEWFRKARSEGDSAEISQGLALILIEQDNAEEAESVMYPWRNDSAEALDTYLNAVTNMLGRIPRKDYSQEVLTRMADVVTEAKSMTAAQQFGWYSNDYGDPLAALQWFEAALSWQPDYEPAAYGVTLMLNTLNYRPGVYLMQRIWAPYSERIAWLNDPNAPVTTIENVMATVFELTALEQTDGTTRTVAVPVAEIDLSTGQQTPLGAAAAPAASQAGGTGVSLTAPLYAPGTQPLTGAAAETAPVNYVPEYYEYYYGNAAAGTPPIAGDSTVASRMRAIERLTIPRSMIQTDPITGVQTVTVLNSALEPEQRRYNVSAAQVQAAFYTTGQPSDKTVIYRFDEQAYVNRDYLRQFQITYYLAQANETGDNVTISTLPAGTQLPAGTPVATVTPAATTTRTTSPATTTTRRTTSTSSSSGGSCWSGRSADGLSPDAALRQGWCLMDMERPMEAARAFETALGSSSAKNREEAAYGQSLAYLRMGLTSKAAVAAAEEPLNSERQLNLQVQILTKRAIAAYQGGHYEDALLILNQRSQLAPDETGLMVIRGYAYYNLGRYFDAQKVFEALTEMGNRKGMEGLALVRGQLGLPGTQ
ncbi:tetratricopeptide repeat protein [Martelella radicis]|uniref:Tetratricopeptide (TPR) repeat protein n=1 Tax=Martelella radicis TaxID=1397476 RepID=A0A7W6KIQ1_9HYPH|nr:tetratricopeptide repeat protein [Martelella radicis]MBB4122011.1 tetratricopeptide (TPR) repeat protein [Martelella radicis]